jgi:hypothetical protein
MGHINSYPQVNRKLFTRRGQVGAFDTATPAEGSRPTITPVNRVLSRGDKAPVGCVPSRGDKAVENDE